MKKILYIDMDNVLVDFPSALARVNLEILEKYENNLDDIPGIFSLMDPVEGALESFKILSEKFDVYILTTAPWNNPSAWSDKLLWVKKYLGESAYKRLIITHHKNLNKGHYLVDDRDRNGAYAFEGTLIRFDSTRFPNWKVVTSYLLNGLESPESKLLF